LILIEELYIMMWLYLIKGIYFDYLESMWSKWKGKISIISIWMLKKCLRWNNLWKNFLNNLKSIYLVVLSLLEEL